MSSAVSCRAGCGAGAEEEEAPLAPGREKPERKGFHRPTMRSDVHPVICMVETAVGGGQIAPKSIGCSLVGQQLGRWWLGSQNPKVKELNKIPR